MQPSNQIHSNGDGNDTTKALKKIVIFYTQMTFFLHFSANYYWIFYLYILFIYLLRILNLRQYYVLITSYEGMNSKYAGQRADAPWNSVHEATFVKRQSLFMVSSLQGGWHLWEWFIGDDSEALFLNDIYSFSEDNRFSEI